MYIKLARFGCFDILKIFSFCTDIFTQIIYFFLKGLNFIKFLLIICIFIVKIKIIHIFLNLSMNWL